MSANRTNAHFCDSSLELRRAPNRCIFRDQLEAPLQHPRLTFDPLKSGSEPVFRRSRIAQFSQNPHIGERAGWGLRIEAHPHYAAFDPVHSSSRSDGKKICRPVVDLRYRPWPVKNFSTDRSQPNAPPPTTASTRVKLILSRDRGVYRLTIAIAIKSDPITRIVD